MPAPRDTTTTDQRPEDDASTEAASSRARVAIDSSERVAACSHAEVASDEHKLTRMAYVTARKQERAAALSMMTAVLGGVSVFLDVAMRLVG